MKMKKFAAVILALALAAGFSACGEDKPATDATSSATQSASEPASAPADDASAPTDASAPSDDAAGGYVKGEKVSDTEYQSDFLNLKVTLPEGWVFATDEEIDAMNQQGQQMMTEDQQKAAQASANRNFYDMAADRKSVV